MTNVRDLVVEKATKEVNDFIKSYKKQTPELMVELAYQLVMYEDILILLEMERCSEEAIEVLAKTDYPVSVCYDAWLKSDASHMEMLEESINDYCE